MHKTDLKILIKAYNKTAKFETKNLEKQVLGTFLDGKQ